MGTVCEEKKNYDVNHSTRNLDRTFSTPWNSRRKLNTNISNFRGFGRIWIVLVVITKGFCVIISESDVILHRAADSTWKPTATLEEVLLPYTKRVAA